MCGSTYDCQKFHPLTRMKIYQHINNSHCGMLKPPVVVKDTIPGIARKDSMSLQDLETKTSDFINTNYPSELWIRVYTDGSAEEAVRNGGEGVLIERLDGTKIENSIPTGRQSTNSNSWMEAAHMQSPKLLSKQLWLENGRATTPTAIQVTPSME